jgi:hypothetical protein
MDGVETSVWFSRGDFALISIICVIDFTFVDPRHCEDYQSAGKVALLD